MQKITPFLWFDNNLEEAIHFYTSIFSDAFVDYERKYPEGGPAGKQGQIMTATFKLAGQEFMGLNGGPMFHFTEAISFFVSCENQEEVDRLWEQLTSGGGAPSQCGWLKDKFGLSWQIVPNTLGTLLADKNPAKAKAVMQALMGMKKLSFAGLQQAYDNA